MVFGQTKGSGQMRSKKLVLWALLILSVTLDMVESGSHDCRCRLCNGYTNKRTRCICFVVQCTIPGRRRREAVEFLSLTRRQSPLIEAAKRAADPEPRLRKSRQYN
ncbi:hypothetical protein ElyMa_001173500 [Elysia marginata]|uniref:Secreted protein n=1 Tax=Elysia marginata TaxID=1093978 RepID=A0AAV4I3Y6_9GAST|nr:hypothetical protein ElyMa_001173500 [Elysia marginata]